MLDDNHLLHGLQVLDNLGLVEGFDTGEHPAKSIMML